MAKNKYTIRYLTSFSEELDEIMYYITNILKNKNAAEKLLDNIHNAIKQRSKSPESFEKYKSMAKTKYNWYRIYVGNFTVFYIVRNNIMEITHLIYCARSFDNLL